MSDEKEIKGIEGNIITEQAPRQSIIPGLRETKNPHLQIAIGVNGKKVTQNGKPMGRPAKAVKPALSGVSLTKAQMRELYNAAFDSNAEDVFRLLFEMAKTDKDLLKYVVDQRLGKAAQQVSGDESAPITVIVRRGLDELPG